MILETLTLLAKAMDADKSYKVAVADLARHSSPPNKILLTLLSQELLDRNELPQPRAVPSLQRVRLTVVAGCYFKDYRKALAALDAARSFAHRNAVLRLAPNDEPATIYVLRPGATELAAYWSALRIPMLPSLFFQLDAVHTQSPKQLSGLPILERNPPS